MRHREPDIDRQKHAIANAFRVACLSIHEKPLKHLATHYQDIMHLPHHIADPKVYHDTLEAARINHNRSVGVPNPEVAHKPHLKSLTDYYAWHHAHHPHLSPSQSREEADREVGVFQYEIEDKLTREKPNKAVDEQAVYKLVDRKLKNFVKPHKEAAPTPQQPIHPDAYPGWHQQSLFGMSHASRHLDKLHQYAREDIAQGGAGHHFRDQILKQNIKHIGPKEASLAWHLLSPNKSQLAYIDHATLDALGYKPDDYNPRDYALYERQLMAARDAAGYDHTPLSLFQKGLIDSYYGPTSHETLAVQDPLRVQYVDWTPPPAPHTWPDWWDETKPYREQPKREWNENEGMLNPPQTVMAAIFKPQNSSTPIFFTKVGSREDFRFIDMEDYTPMEGHLITIDSPDPESRVTYTTRLIIDPKLATIGPNVDNEVNDALANDSGDPMPMPDMNWFDDRPCEFCHGNKVIQTPTGPKACPSCTSWEESRMFDEPSLPDPTLEENPSGVRDESPGSIGP